MKKLLSNKKGDIPVTLLVIGVIAICMMAITSFYFFDRATKSDLNSVGVVEKMAVTMEKYSFYKNSLNFDEEEISNVLDVKSDSRGKYLYFEQEGVSVRYNLP